MSQFLVGFATTFTLGPLFLYGLGLALPKGPAAFISFLAAYSTTANLGSLGAFSLVSSYETLREKAHSHQLVEYVVSSHPPVVTRLTEASHLYSAVTADPTLRATAGAALLDDEITRESSVLAYIDVFQAIALLAALTAAFLLALILWRRYRASRAAALSA
ncbi:MAG TPA: hypothetical protein VM713_05230 [Steroidobacteraceae bacterium]|nr:hypothetical protein [Steroidobacteraceae bacterium]